MADLLLFLLRPVFSNAHPRPELSKRTKAPSRPPPTAAGPVPNPMTTAKAAPPKSDMLEGGRASIISRRHLR